MLTLKKLEDMAPGTVFATGEIPNSPEGVFMTRDHIGKSLRWAARRGAIHDWAIYIFWADKDVESILKSGDKVRDPEHIRKLVPCDDEALKMYRK